MKPGRAVQTRLRTSSVGMPSAILSAMVRGFICIDLASFSGRLQEKSPFSMLFGLSMAGSSTSVSGRSPFD